MELALSIDELSARVGPFVQLQGVRGDFHLERIAAGGNNRVYRLKHSGDDRILKVYFRSHVDTRDRLGAEQCFYNFVWEQGIRRTPEPFGWDVEFQLGLFSFVEGRKLRSEEVNDLAVDQALQFVTELNQARDNTRAREMPVASEACFTIADHLKCVDARVSRLCNIQPISAIDRDALAFVSERLEPVWTRIRASISKSSETTSPLLHKDRCLSPSDFGFHNALMRNDGTLSFFDFEYAGWDDPAKLICDFFCQPQVPVNSRHWFRFVETISTCLLDPMLPGRAELLLRAYRVKWCCILLNEFVRADRARREFASGIDSERKAIQLKKAGCALEQIES
jgi:hypothetical protein